MNGVTCDPEWVEGYLFRLSNGAIPDSCAGTYGNGNASCLCICPVGPVISVLFNGWLSTNTNKE